MEKEGSVITMANVTCPVGDYTANTNEEIMGHMKQMTDDQHKNALKQKLGEKGGEAMGDVKDKADDVVSDVKDKF